jgi:putative PIG3 family NAD(P)H quinone oxidoreductase
MNTSMRAVQVQGDRLRWAQVDAPALVPGGVRVLVHAAGINRADLAQRAGRYPPPPGASLILGLEAAGVIIEIAPDVRGWKVGDRVAALLSGGGYAEQVVVDARHLVPIPEHASFDEAAAFTEVFVTAWLNLQHEGGLLGTRGKRVLLHAGGSGVGTAAVQLCRVLGHHSFVTAGHPDKIATCRALGAEGGADRHDGPWLDAVQAWAPEGVDLILDPVAAGYLANNQRALGLDGRLVVIGLLSGARAELDLGRLLMLRQRIIGSTLRSRDDGFKAGLIAELNAEVVPRWARKEIAPVLDRTFPIAGVEAAHAFLASNDSTGALVLRVRA